jgi:hypothetical protein
LFIRKLFVRQSLRQSRRRDLDFSVVWRALLFSATEKPEKSKIPLRQRCPPQKNGRQVPPFALQTPICALFEPFLEAKRGCNSTFLRRFRLVARLAGPLDHEDILLYDGPLNLLRITLCRSNSSIACFTSWNRFR